MSIEPIHELPADELNLILDNAKQFIEWNIEPKFSQLNTLVDSIKKSLIHFLPPHDTDLITDINDAQEATYIIDSFTDYPHPLKEGLIVLRELFYIINTGGENFYKFKIITMINDYLDTIKPFILEEKVEKAALLIKAQKGRRAKRKTWGGLTKEEIEARNQKIIAKFKNSKLTNPKLTPNSFANKYQNLAAFNRLKLTRIKTIIKEAQNK